MRRLLDRITVWSALAAASPAVVALVFVTVHVFGWSWGGRFTPRDLERMLTYEVLLIHAFGFVGLALLARPVRLRSRVIRGVVVWGLLGLYACTAHREDGWTGVVTLFGLGLATYAGCFFHLVSERAMVGLGRRWLVNMLTLVFVVGLPVGVWIQVVEGKSAQQITEVPAIGIGYFALLAAFELFRLYDGGRDGAVPSPAVREARRPAREPPVRATARPAAAGRDRAHAGRD